MPVSGSFAGFFAQERREGPMIADADTVADIAGAIAAATPGMKVPQEWADRVFDVLDDELKSIFVEFHKLG